LLQPVPLTKNSCLVVGSLKFADYIDYYEQIQIKDKTSSDRVQLKELNTTVRDTLAQEIATDAKLTEEILKTLFTSGQTSATKQKVSKLDAKLDLKFKKEFYNREHQKYIQELKDGIKLKEKNAQEESMIFTKSDGTVGKIRSMIKKYGNESFSAKELILQLSKSQKDQAILSNLLPERRRDEPDIEEILSILAKQTQTSVMDVFPGINVDKIDEIYQTVVELAYYQTAQIHWEEVLELYNEPEVDSAKLYRMINKTRTEEWLDIPWIMSFEASFRVRLTQDQTKVVKMLGTLSKNKDEKYAQKIVQRLMAYGKTFVLGTCLAMAKADGQSLSIIIPPTALMEKNSKDMMARANKAFGQSAHVINFFREDHLGTEAKLLVKISSTIRKAIRERGFVIMSIETVQSMLNRWVLLKREIIVSTRSTDQILKKNLPKLKSNLKLLDGILEVFRTKGEVLFDEIDMTFDPFKDLSFPTGPKSLVNPLIVQMILNVTKMMSMDMELKNKGINIVQGTQSKNVYSSECKSLVIKHIVDWFRSHLNIKEVDRLEKILKVEPTVSTNGTQPNPVCYEQEISRLTNEFLIAEHGLKDTMDSSENALISPKSEDTTPNYPNMKLSDEDVGDTDSNRGSRISDSGDDSGEVEAKKKVAKHEEKLRNLISAAYLLVHFWLKRDLKSEVGVSMGRAASPNYLFARPFSAANTPKESSEFSDEWQTIILTCFLYANQGMTSVQIDDWIDFLRSQPPPAMRGLEMPNEKDNDAGDREGGDVNVKDKDKDADEIGGEGLEGTLEQNNFKALMAATQEDDDAPLD